VGGENGSMNGHTAASGSHIGGVEVQQNPQTPPPGYDEAVESSWMRTRLANFGIQRDPVRLVRFNQIPTNNLANIPANNPINMQTNSHPSDNLPPSSFVEPRSRKLDTRPSITSSSSSDISSNFDFQHLQIQPQLHNNRPLYTSYAEPLELRRV